MRARVEPVLISFFAASAQCRSASHTWEMPDGHPRRGRPARRSLGEHGELRPQRQAVDLRHHPAAGRALHPRARLPPQRGRPRACQQPVQHHRPDGAAADRHVRAGDDGDRHCGRHHRPHPRVRRAAAHRRGGPGRGPPGRRQRSRRRHDPHGRRAGRRAPSAAAGVLPAGRADRTARRHHRTDLRGPRFQGHRRAVRGAPGRAGPPGRRRHRRGPAVYERHTGFAERTLDGLRSAARRPGCGCCTAPARAGTTRRP